MQSQNTIRKSRRNSRKDLFFFIILKLISAKTRRKKWSMSNEGVLFLQTSFTFSKCGKMIDIKSILNGVYEGIEHF